MPKIWTRRNFMEKKLKILRRKIIPDQLIDLTERDNIIYIDENVIVSEWKTISYHKDFSHGRSYTFLNDGYKIGKFYDTDNHDVCLYCHIISCDVNAEQIIVTDLLLDVKILPDGKVFIYDHKELAEAIRKKIITNEMVCYALEKLDNLLEIIYSGNFPPAIIHNIDKNLYSDKYELFKF